VSSSHFDHIAHHYDRSLPEHVVEHYLRKRTAFVLEHCPRGDLLDVGCGTGTLAARLASEGYRVTGIDPSEGMLDVLRDGHPEVQAVQGTGTDLPFADDSFDVVMSVAVMHHVADPGDVRTTLGEMVRVCRPDGRILHWDHNPGNPYWKSLMGRVPQDTGEERLIPEEEVTSALAAAGAEVVLSAKLGFVPDFVPRRAVRRAATAERMLERTPGVRRVAAHNVILAAKAEARTP